MVDWMDILREIPWSPMIWEIAKWTLLGGFAGTLIGLGVFIFSLKFKYYIYSSNPKRWIIVIICAWMLISYTILTAALGLFEGLFRSCEVGLRKSAIGEKWLPQASAYGAELFFRIDQILNQKDAPAERLDVNKFVEKLKYLQDAAAESYAREMINKALDEHPEWKNTNSETLIRWTLPWLVRKLFDQKLKDSCDKWGIEGFIEELRKQAPKTQGQMLDRDDISRFLSNKVIVPGILYYMKGWIRSSQIVIALILLGVTALPICVTQLSKWFIRSKIGASTRKT